MKETVFDILKMDCFSEEQMIRMKLDGDEQIISLNFDISNNKLKVIHTKNYKEILEKLEELNLGTRWVETKEVLGNQSKVSNYNTQKERNILYKILGINFGFFLLEIVIGLFVGSMGLVADSLDMLADSLVYILALFAVGKTIELKKRVAKISGYFQLILAIIGLLEIIRRFMGFEIYPNFRVMIFISILALIGNMWCLYLLQKNKSQEAHMKASIIFTSNDIVINLGVIFAGIMVYLTNTNIPDLIIGIIIFFIVARGAMRILRM